MDGRRERRLFLKCPISFEGKQGVIQGTLFNLSPGGGAVESDVPVQCGTVLTLRVHLPSLKQPIEVERAEVTWTAGDDFGVQFRHLNPQERERLNHVIEAMLPGMQQQARQFHHA